MILGIDASRNRSGGAVNHIIGIITYFRIEKHGIDHIHLWSYPDLLDKIPDFPWLSKHSPPALKKTLLSQLIWQRFMLIKEAQRLCCDLMFDTDAGSISAFKPYVSMSQDLLNFEKDSTKSYRIGFAWLRLKVLYYVQKNSFRNANGVIFLTKYSSNVIQKHTGKLTNVRIIPHGIDPGFNKDLKLKNSLRNNVIDCIYISPILEYKNHLQVLDAIFRLRKDGIQIRITLVGDDRTDFGKFVLEKAKEYDPNAEFIFILGKKNHENLPEIQSRFDFVIFASGVENMPITLMESMLMGLPIACSNQGPMPEVLGDAGVYFDPYSVASIYSTLEQLVRNDKLRLNIGKKAKQLALNYTWDKCSENTFSFLEEIGKDFNKNKRK
ncbi:glycosyl transferase group 1 [Leptospira ellinghausenii]|uniref:Glycosyl transferase group 1 n=1 Tax=Leptospira ellinghausenii TaxID=1917822 RepID=A0A2P2D9P2_9LEPT|nr:glycosyltransferase [Leptospira ellinghausenii]GBF41357.1 glycosyl transferase group 1 [Leptospira ellinghausenii]